MSSSVFAKSPVSSNESRIDSNLVVVFGRNGINVDRKGLENLVDEKSSSTISVIRLTSPTPSMEEQGQENDELQIKKATKKKTTNDDVSEIDDNSESDEDNDESEEDDNENEDEDEDDELLATLKGKKYKKREKPEIVGLTVENFYLPEEAKQIAKQVLNASGVNPLCINVGFDVQRRAIENDHCYTPLLSPSQLNENKLSDNKILANASTSKTSQHKIVNSKTKKISSSGDTTESVNSGKTDSIDEKSLRMENKSNNEADEEFEDDDSEYEIESLDTDNDRDSDLDFSVYDRNCKKQRKSSTKKTPKRLSTMNKVPKKRQSSFAETHSQDIDDNKKVAQQQSVRANRLSSESKTAIKPSINPAQQNLSTSEPALINLQPSVAKYLTPVVSKTKINLPTISKQPILLDKNIKQPTIKLNKLVTGDQCGKAIIENVVIIKQAHKTTESLSSGSFTDISKYLTKVEPNKTNIKVSELVKTDNKISPIIVTHTVPKPTIGNIQQQQQIKTIKRGFMPLESTTTNKNQLPTQISIQTHQSSSELLAAENDKQLDLIDSIVKDEMKKSNIIDKESINKNVNIPKLVKMLESTENVVYGQHQQQASAISTMQATTITPNTSVSTFRNTVEDIDIANAPLLDTPTDEIPEDLLKDVAELIDNKTLQEFVEKQNLIDQQNQSLPSISTDFESNITSNLVMSTQQEFNSSAAVEIKASASLNINQETSVTVRNEPIQIIQRNGKVITLPPIEAPATRAKRRAANSSISINNLENNEATVSTSQNTPKQINITPTGSSLSNEKSGTSSRRGSKEQTKSETIRKNRASTSSVQNNLKTESGGDSSEGEEDDDDPNKLWCICRQPHNNRFMICCDICEDWFHGACVNVTKAMGLEMEQKGVEWTCPKCLKTKKPLQRKITDSFVKKSTKMVQQKKSFDSPHQPKKIQQQQPQKLQISDVKKEMIIKRQSIDSSSGSGSSTPKLIQKQIVVLPGIKQNKPEIPKKNINFTTISTPATSIAIPTEQQIIKQEYTSQSSITQKIIQITPKKTEETLYCIVCKKLARSNSIYCSDDCIRRHASNALVTKVTKVLTTPTSLPLGPGELDKKKKVPSSFEEALAIASHLQPKKVERVYVYERKSGRLLTGSNAPTTTNLKKWLQDNPTFEVVQPGSPQAIAIEKNKQKIRSQSNSSEITSPSTSALSFTQIQQSPILIKVSKPTTPILNKLNKIDLSLNTKERSNSPKLLQKYPQQVKIRPDKQETPKLVKRPSLSLTSSLTDQSTLKDSKETTKKTTPQSEPIRLNVKRTLKEQLTLRMNELKESDENAVLLTANEIEKFANKTEEEMFKLFNKDTNNKYRVKYRSLTFNLKDRKNKTLFKKICEKLVEPHQLVRMSPEELASQELAQWRQNENKHQLEMIKKSELDLLSCAKNYVLKTHKGEEVIESKSTDRVNLDISIPVEDVVTVLNNSTVSSTSELDKTVSPIKDTYKTLNLFDTTYDNDNSFTSSSTAITKSITEGSTFGSITKSLSSDKKKSGSKDRDRDHREKRHKSKDRHKEKSRKRSRSRSRSRERTKHNKSPYKDNKKDYEKRKESRHYEPSKTSKTSGNKQLSLKTTDKVYKTKDNLTEPKADTPIQTYNLIDEILESSKTIEEAANLKVPDIEKKLPPTSTSAASNLDVKTYDPTLEHKKVDNDSDQEPSSTVVITTPPPEEDNYNASELDKTLWTGSINMIDVATFRINIQPISGIYMDLDKYLPKELDVIGRISPDSVWNYISQIKKNPNKEVVIIKLSPSSETQNIAYSALYVCLIKRDRLGVVQVSSPAIRDFYILPLESRQSLPPVLQPATNPIFFEDNERPDLLLGIVIRVMPSIPLSGIKRPHSNANITGIPAVKVKRRTETAVISIKSVPTISLEEEKEHYTPPGTPPIVLGQTSKTKLSNRFALQTSSSKDKSEYDDADEPYSPGGSSGDDDMLSRLSTRRTSVNVDQDDLKRKMDEINRQIEAQQQEIAGMLGADAYSPTDTTLTAPTLAPALANISIPSNLQQILASIQSKPVVLETKKLTPSSDEYSNREESYKTSAPPSTSRLAQLSEEELLSMVPDGIEINKKNQDTVKSYTSPQPLLSPTKRARWDVEPPPPGLEDEFE